MKTTVLVFLFFMLVIVLVASCNSNNQSTKDSLIDSSLSTQTEKKIDTQLSRDTTVIDTNITTSTNFILVPGVSAGQTKIGENADSVYQRLGTPDGGDAAMQKAVAIWFAHHDTTAYSMAIYTAQNTDSPAIARVLQIRITSPSFKTKEGIHTTSPLAEIKKVFAVKQTEQYADAKTNYTIYDSKEGIAFEVNPGNSCIAILIHKAGITGEGTYLKFRTTNMFINRK